MTGIDPRAWSMPEDRGPDSLEANMRAIMKDLGLWGFHVRNSIGSERGWPDWVILGPRGGLHRELKSQRGALSPEQRSVGARLIAAGFNWGVWRPQDLFSGVIAAQLVRIAGIYEEAA